MLCDIIIIYYFLEFFKMKVIDFLGKMKSKGDFYGTDIYYTRQRGV